MFRKTLTETPCIRILILITNKLLKAFSSQHFLQSRYTFLHIPIHIYHTHCHTNHHRRI